LPAQRLEALIARYAELEAALSQRRGRRQVREALARACRTFAGDRRHQGLKQAQDDLAEAERMLEGDDPEMAKLAADEKRELQARSKNLKGRSVFPKDEADARDAILEVRAGTGGDEASLFAGDLFRMYERYAALAGLEGRVVSMSEGARPAATRKSSRRSAGAARLRG
jgi:peptide chain release factor 1